MISAKHLPIEKLTAVGKWILSDKNLYRKKVCKSEWCKKNKYVFIAQDTVPNKVLDIIMRDI